MTSYTTPTPTCPECGANLLVKNYITDTLAECSSCGETVSFNVHKNRDISHSPSPQRDVKTF